MFPNLQAEQKRMNMTNQQVADEIGISQAQVSRIEKGALNKIKSEI